MTYIYSFTEEDMLILIFQYEHKFVVGELYEDGSFRSVNANALKAEEILDGIHTKCRRIL